jgi:hypothetical protein
MRRIGLLDVIVQVMFVFPMVAVGVLLGFAFGWQLPVAFTLAMGFLLAFASRPDRSVGAIRATIESVGAALVGSVVGGLLLGGLGAIFGFVFGLIARLSQVPITTGPSFRFIHRKQR